MSELGFSGTKAASVVGISYRQLDYWARTDLIRPALTDATGSGSRRTYCFHDPPAPGIFTSVHAAGIHLDPVRLAFT